MSLGRLCFCFSGCASAIGEFMKVKGEVVSCAVMSTIESCQNWGQPHNPAFDGWQVMFRYSCPCGTVHDSQGFNVWPTGDHEADIVRHACPATNKSNEIELAK